MSMGMGIAVKSMEWDSNNEHGNGIAIKSMGMG